MAEHTLGNLSVVRVDSGEHSACFEIQDECGNTLAQVWWDDGEYPRAIAEVERNAHLFAAAPALLAACEAFMACYVRPTPGGSAHAYKLGEAAIALARGEKEAT